MPQISVIIPTNRMGGLDVTFEMLAAQTFKDFELVLIDHLHPYRHEVVAERAARYPFPVRHVRPWSDPFPEQAYQRACNTGLLYAQSPLILFTCDFAYLPPDTLEKHALFHASSSAPRALIGTFRLVSTPAVKTGFPIGRYGAGTVEAHRDLWNRPGMRMKACHEWVANYLEDLRSGVLGPFGWSIFDPEFVPTAMAGLTTVHEEPKLTFAEGPCHPNDCHLKNDSFPLEQLLTINGFDEDFDGCHAYQDTEIANRLHKIGVQFFLKPKLTVNITDVHHLMTIRKIARPESANHQLFNQKYVGPMSGSFANAAFRIRELRKYAQEKA
jgi:glycosyltransferase involved in cell wall biosynthesis